MSIPKEVTHFKIRLIQSEIEDWKTLQKKIAKEIAKHKKVEAVIKGKVSKYEKNKTGSSKKESAAWGKILDSYTKQLNVVQECSESIKRIIKSKEKQIKEYGEGRY